jgi:hypothetical protein
VLPLHFPKVWSALAWLLTAAVIVASLVPSAVVASIGLGDKFMHASAYFVLMVSFAGLYRRGLYLFVAVVLLALGLTLEFLQTFTETRVFDWDDGAMNAVGITAGLVLSWWLLGGWCQRVEQRLLS